MSRSPDRGPPGRGARPPAPPPTPLGSFDLDRRRFLLGALAGAGALAIGACAPGSSGSSGGRPTLRLHQGAFGFPSPFACNAGPGYNQMSLVYDSLLWRDGTGQLLPWLARSFTVSDDRLTYSFELREGVRWSDGRPLTAEDVRFTFEYYADQRALPPPVTVQPPQGIARVTATGTTVTIVLEAPDVRFADQVAGALPIIPAHVWASITEPTEALDPKVAIGSGAYRLASYAGDGDPLLFVARDDYMLGRPFVRRVECNGINDEARFSAMLADRIDAASGTGLRPNEIARFTDDPAFGTITQRAASTTCLYWNLVRGGVLADPAFRRACALAIDRRDLVVQLAGGNGTPGNPGFLGPDNPFYTPVPQYDFDPAGAGALLDAAGYRRGPTGGRQGPNGAPLSLELLAGTTDAPVADLVADALRKLGVDIRPRRVEIGPQLFGTKLTNGYDLALLPYPGPSAGGPNADPDILRQLFSSTAPPSLTGASGYRNLAFDALAEKQRITFDEAERKAVVAEMQKTLANDLPVLSLYYPETVLLFRKGVLDDWYFTPGQFPTSENNKQLFITGQKAGSEIREPR